MTFNPQQFTLRPAPECTHLKLSNHLKITITMQPIIDILKECTCSGNIIKLPARQLDREDYLAVKKKLELIGGKWKGGKVYGFEFKEDPQAMLDEIAGGEDRNLKKEYQFFATPRPLADRMVKMAAIEKRNRVLEPSAGQGSIVKSIFDHYNFVRQIDCFELMPINRKFLDEIEGLLIVGNDFLESEHFKGYYDRIIANPPFTKNQDIDHIRKMYDCLKDGGRMVTLSSCSWYNGSQKKQIEFREWLDEIGAFIEDIPEGTFKESGTTIKTKLIVINKPVKVVQPIAPTTIKRKALNLQLNLF